MSHSMGIHQARERALCYQHFSKLFIYPSNLDEVGSKLADRKFEYLASFDCAVHSGACSLFASDHCPQSRTALFEELLRFYNHYGLERATDAEQPDHMTILLQFMHFLTCYESECMVNGHSVVDLQRAQWEFISRFLLPLSNALAERLGEENIFYESLCDELRQFLYSEMLSLKKLDS